MTGHAYRVTLDARGAGGRRVLLVEPDAGMRAELMAWLTADGYAVHAVSTFEEARRSLVSRAPHVLIAEVRLGGFNGLQLAIRSRLQDPGAVTIVTSAVADPVLADEARRHGARWLMKPVTQAALRAAVALPASDWRLLDC